MRALRRDRFSPWSVLGMALLWLLFAAGGFVAMVWFVSVCTKLARAWGWL